MWPYAHDCLEILSEAVERTYSWLGRVRRLEPQNGSHTTGHATLTETDGGVRLELSLGDLPNPDTTYLAHIHPGTCSEGEEGEEHEEGDEHAEHSEEDGGAAGEEIEWPLTSVQSDAQGHGLSTTTLDNFSMEKIFTGEVKHLNVHAAGSGNPPVLSCADLY